MPRLATMKSPRKKGRYVSVSGRLKVSTNVKEDKTYVNLDVWVSNIDLAPAGKD